MDIWRHLSLEFVAEYFCRSNLETVLQDRGWVIEMTKCAELDRITPAKLSPSDDTTLVKMSFEFEITARGLLKMREIVKLFFTNVRFFQKNAVKESIYHEVKITSILEFYYRVNPTLLVESAQLASNRKFVSESDSDSIFNAQ